jgi:spoIIIJ-associated protein
MKGKSIEEAKKAALTVLGISEEGAEVRVIKEGKPAMLGVIGGEEAEVEIIARGSKEEEAKEALQNILDKMGFLAAAEAKTEDDAIKLQVKGEDMGRIIGKEGAMLKSLETVVAAILRKLFKEGCRVRIDAGGYQEKREKTLERLAEEIAKDVEASGEEKTMPYMEAADRRIIHTYIKDRPKVTSYSKGEGKERRLVIAPK